MSYKKERQVIDTFKEGNVIEICTCLPNKNEKQMTDCFRQETALRGIGNESKITWEVFQVIAVVVAHCFQPEGR
jgi:hypothetical protein